MEEGGRTALETCIKILAGLFFPVSNDLTKEVVRHIPSAVPPFLFHTWHAIRLGCSFVSFAGLDFSELHSKGMWVVESYRKWVQKGIWPWAGDLEYAASRITLQISDELWCSGQRNTGASLGSQKLRKCGCAECLKEVSFAVGALLIEAADSWPLSCPRCCGRVWQWDWRWWQHGQSPGPLLFCWLRQEKAEGQPAQGIRSDSPRLAVWTPIQCLPLRARKSVTVPANTLIYTTGKGKAFPGVVGPPSPRPRITLQHSYIASHKLPLHSKWGEAYLFLVKFIVLTANNC